MVVLNGFITKNVPEKLWVTEVTPISPKGVVFDLNDDKLKYAASAVLAKKLSCLESPVASYGTTIISQVPPNITDTKIPLDYRGIYYKDVYFSSNLSKEIESKNPKYRDLVKRYLNRSFDEFFLDQGFNQDRRFFWKTGDEAKIGRVPTQFIQRKGFTARVLPLDSGIFVLQADYRTQIVGGMTVEDMINYMTKKKEVENWREIPVEELNKAIHRVGGSLRATYQRLGKSGAPESTVYIFSHFDTSRTIEDFLIEFHKKRNRHVKNKDQPVVVCRKGKGMWDFIPTHLVPSVSLQNLKNVSATYSKIAQKNAKKSIPFRYEALTEDYLSKCLEIGILDHPIESQAVILSPIVLDVGSGKPIPVSKDLDFDQFYKRKSLYHSPVFKRIVIVTDKQDWNTVEEFVMSFVQDLEGFGVSVSYVDKQFESKRKYSGEVYNREFKDFVSEKVSPEIGKEDLLMIVPPESKHWSGLRKQLKQELTPEDIAIQFIRLNNIKNTKDRDKRLNKPLLLQDIAKMGGTPFVYQFSNILEDAVFIGLDRSYYSRTEDPSVSAAAAVFSNTGEYLFAGTTTLDSRHDDSIKLENLEILVRDIVDRVLKTKPELKKLIVLRDSGPGKFMYLQEEAEICSKVAENMGLTCVFILCNKSAGWRLFDRDSEGNIQRADQFTAVLDYGMENRFILQSTAPLTFDPSADQESPSTTTYEIRENTTELSVTELKELLARCLLAMTRMNMRSWRTCRLPTPLHYADTLAQFCREIGAPWPTKIQRPLFL